MTAESGRFVFASRGCARPFQLDLLAGGFAAASAAGFVTNTYGASEP